jgi:hypothetical protein
VPSAAIADVPQSEEPTKLHFRRRPDDQERCSPCHFPGGVSAQIETLETYTDVVNAQTAIIAQLYACLMPPIHGNAMYGIAPDSVPGLTAEQVNTIVDWIECGAPDN